MRQKGLFGAEAEDFASWVKVKLLEMDYAILRKLAGRSSLKTYLTLVISHLFCLTTKTCNGGSGASAAAKA